ncbi:type IIL restriction-modification enzyme MmeI [Bradyrhizobium betae]|uniref:type IIL restriction-modification enzyme MmeI n=1 Tax=Bradyrhizobium betae TaxID=244734 RepID=UPI003D67A1E8
MNESADFVMYWWDRAAEILTRKGTLLRRFGFVTTNSISQVFQRRVMEKHLNAKKPISLVMAINDHPWTKASEEAAQVRIAMTVGEAGMQDGVLREVISEAALDTDAPDIELREIAGRVNSDLTVGIDITSAKALLSNEGVCSPGVKLHGPGFIVTSNEASLLGLGKRPGLEKHIRPYRNGRDLAARPRDVMVIDLYGLNSDQTRASFPEVYQHLLSTVKIQREKEAIRSGSKDSQAYAKLWWIFGKPRQELRPALDGLERYIVTAETTKHRVFQFLDASILPDNMLLAIASDDAHNLGVLSSRVHVTWALRAGGWLGVGNDPRYSKSRCFDPFPFPRANNIQKQEIRLIAEEIDTHRKRVLAEHQHLTLTGLYNVLESLRAGTTLDTLANEQRTIFEDGFVLILEELHDRLDAAVAQAYGWQVDLSDEEILARLVALNKERAAEERRGLVRWLRPDYQIPRFAKGLDKQAAEEAGMQVAAQLDVTAKEQKPSFPANAVEQTAAVFAALAQASVPLDAAAIAAQFRKAKASETKIAGVLASLARLGHVTTDGKEFALRRVA